MRAAAPTRGRVKKRYGINDSERGYPDESPGKRTGNTILFVVDASGSMGPTGGWLQ